ncbi:MAG: MarR family transcriptional regulator [Candidatus Nitrosopumilus sp. bin_7KS]
MGIVTISKTMPERPYQAQFDTKNKNIAKVLNALKDSPKLNKDLKRICKLSDAGLSNILKRMMKNKLIEYDSKNRNYYIVDKGFRALEESDISYITNRIRDDDGTFYRYYSGVYQTLIPRRRVGAIKPFMYIDKSLDSLNLFSTEDVEEIEKLAFKKLSQSIKRNKLVEKNTGDIVLGFVIDYRKAEILVKTGKMK